MTAPPSADEVAEIAKGLTEAQRAWLLTATPTLDEVPQTPCAEWWDNPERLYVETDEGDRWLASRRMCSPEGSSSFECAYEQLTPLGLAVRNRLIGETR